MNRPAAFIFDLNGTMLRISTLPDYEPPQHTVLGWDIPDIVATVTALRAKGVKFNVYDGSVFNGLSSTLDTPLNYSALGAIACALISGDINEIYCFKISQTIGSGYPAKNGTHFVDSSLNGASNAATRTKPAETAFAKSPINALAASPWGWDSGWGSPPRCSATPPR